MPTPRCPKTTYIFMNENGVLFALPNEWNKWKNHYYEMKGDVGMSLHEKERNKKMPSYTKTQSHS